MKKYHLYTFLLVCFTVISAFAGDTEIFSYGPDGKNLFTQAEDRILIQFQDGLSFGEKTAILSSEKSILRLSKEDVLPAPNVTIANVSGLNAEQLSALLSRLNENPQVKYANPFLIYKDGTYQGIQNRVIVRLKSTKDIGMMYRKAKELNLNVLEKNEFDPLMYVLETSKLSGNAVEVANALHLSSAFDYAEPDFLLLLKRFNTNDTFLDYQWSLNNTGSGLQYNGTAGADMDIFTAWGQTTGSSSIKVAVIDEGVDLNHPDLVGNILGGYDATGQGSGGGPQGDDAHGTACAGIIAASGNNNTGIAGVAYSCKIIPVRIAYSSGTSWVTSNTWIGNALNWAWQTGGADVLSNSWGGGSSSATINNAIDGAVNNGRSGLGAPVLFAAGNDNGANSYPATQTNVISVIAMSMCYERKNPSSCDGETWWGSNFGAGADVCAPGVKIYTTDISGASGYGTGDYTATFNGTSSATPNTAGVMALILSANSSLTQAQARFALESTCQKVGSYTYNSGVSGQPAGTWSNDLGYGLVNACQAILSVSPQVTDDAGISSIASPSGSICATSAIPQVTLSNFGSNTLNSVTVNYQLDAGTVNTFNWNGSLASGSTTSVTLASIGFSSGAHSFTAWTSSPNGNSDNTPANDQSSSSFTSASNGVTLTIVLDNYPEETSWQILNGATVLASGGTYGSQPDGSTVIENICLPDGCFDFVINDTYGDGICCNYGNGSYILTADVGGATLASGGSFTFSETTNFCVTSSNPLSASISASGDVSCNGGADGSATAMASGGATPYSYLWSNGATTATATGLTAGTYTVTLTDGNSDQATANVTISQPSAMSATASGNDVNCNGQNDGSASVSVSGGTAPYSYAWSNGATSASISGLTAGTYSVTVTDANGCTANSSTTLSQPTLLTHSVSTTDADCNGLATGSATVSPTGGVPPYSYAWSNGATGATATGLAAAAYSCTITDANGCTDVALAIIGQPAAMSLSTSTTDASCGAATNGAVNLTVSGGAAPYTYNWSNGATTQDLAAVASGSYSVTVTDANGCSANASAIVGQSSTLTSSASSSDASCNGSSDGSASVSVSGGTTPYSYAWSNGATTASISGLAAGTYSVTVTDANGCSASANATVGEPSAINANASSSDVSCNGAADGSASVSVSGGTSPYSYDWSNGATTNSISGLSAGTYSVTITDANGCTANASATIGEPSSMSASASSSDASCNGASDGSATVSVSGGTSPYSYVWSNGATTNSISGLSAGTYSVTVTDANGCTANTSATIGEPSALNANTSSSDANCNGASDGSASVSVSGGTAPYSYVWSNGATTNSVSGLSAGTYSVTVTDANGCVANATVTVGEPAAMALSTSTTDASCGAATDGAVNLTVSGGATPYSYNWSNGATTQDLTSVASGSYSVTVTDANGCSANASAIVSQSSTLSSSASSSDASCNGSSDGSASVSVSGGTTPYSYAWSNGATTATVSGLAAGTYSATATDAAGCTTSATVTIGEPSAINATASGNDVNCFGQNDGSASVSVSGGTAPYSYNWSNGATTASISGLTAGIYSVTVTDANGCSANSSTTLSQPSLLTNTLSSTDADCNGAVTGAASVTVSGGVAPYSYAWSNGATTSSVSGLSAGSYSVTITDANGCADAALAIIGEPSAISLSASAFDASCNGANDGSASVSVSGGTASYNYAWSNGATTNSTNGLSAGTYSVTVTDANGCSANASATVNEPTAISVGMSSVEATCATADGSASASVSGGIAPYSYAWSSGATTATATGLAAGSYTVAITDANGCTANGSVSVAENCGGCTYVSIDSNDFESGWGIWNDGGSDCWRTSNTSYSNSGSYSVRLRDNTNSSVATTDNLNLLAFSELTINFSYIAVSMDNSSEDFWLQISTDGGSSFTTIAEWNRDDEFVNNQRYNETVVYPGVFSTTTKLRFRCDASGNSDWVYIDDVVITGCQGAIPDPTCTDGIMNGDETGVDCGGSQCVPCVTCSDGIQNGDETGIDCGGSFCLPCSGAGCTYVIIDDNSFDQSWGIWNDGGADCRRSSNDAAYANSGSFCARIRDNTSTSVMTTDLMDLTNYDELTIDFSFITVSLESGEDFWFQISSDGGSTYSTVQTWVKGTDFSNYVRSSGQVVINGPFAANSKLRIRCDATDNGDKVYIDDVRIMGCLKTGARFSSPAPEEDVAVEIAPSLSNINLYPNPTSDNLNVEFSLANSSDLEIRVMDMTGKLVYQQTVSQEKGANKFKLNTNEMPLGMYVITLIADTEMATKRFIVQR